MLRSITAKNFGFTVGNICRIDSPLQKRNGRTFEILGFIYDKDIDAMVGCPCGLKVKYLDTNRKGTYRNSFDSLTIIS
jgi:hypothetical protein